MVGTHHSVRSLTVLLLVEGVLKSEQEHVPTPLQDTVAMTVLKMDQTLKPGDVIHNYALVSVSE